MKLVDFLVYLLQTHAKTLKRLSALFGEELFFEILEQSAENSQSQPFLFTLNADGFDPPKNKIHRHAYMEIEGVVRELKLPEVLEFHLWSYPFYRFIIEGSVDLQSQMRKQDSSSEFLVKTAVEYARHWVRQLPLPPELVKTAEQAAIPPWIRFRSEVLKKLGKPPFEVL